MLADRIRPVPVDVSDRAGVGLGEVVQEAANLTRVDRKYLIDRRLAESFLTLLPASFRVRVVEFRGPST